jgi:hypothetical protein
MTLSKTKIPYLTHAWNVLDGRQHMERPEMMEVDV